MTPASERIPSLDGLRALAFLLVFGSHTLLPDEYGDLGVTVFFGLSGYLIATLLRQEEERSGRIDVLAFYLRRAVRILPALYAVLAAACVLTVVGAREAELRPWAVLSQLLHWTNYYRLADGDRGLPLGTNPYWSIAVEEHFYLVFPLLLLVLIALRVPRGRRAALLLGGCAAVLLWRLHLVDGGAGYQRTYLATDTRLDSILLGCVLALWRNPWLDRPLVGRSRVAAWLTLPAGVVALVAATQVQGDTYRWAVMFSVQGLTVLVVLTGAVAFATTGVGRLLNGAPLVRLGTWSYSAYLLHRVVIVTVERVLPEESLASTSVAFVVTVALAGATYALVERPARRWGRDRLRARELQPRTG